MYSENVHASVQNVHASVQNVHASVQNVHASVQNVQPSSPKSKTIGSQTKKLLLTSLALPQSVKSGPSSVSASNWTFKTLRLRNKLISLSVPLTTHINLQRTIFTSSCLECKGDSTHQSSPDNSVEKSGGRPSREPLGQIQGQKMMMIFTCKVCNERSAKLFSKTSYQNGVVIVKCPGCHNNHLVADNLGWFEDVTKKLV
jgi:hypothetical protein